MQNTLTTLSLSPSNKIAVSIGIGLGVTIAASGLGYWYYQNCKKNRMPKKWRRIGTLSEIYLFPIKSCAPLKLDTKDANGVPCEILGLEWQSIVDRCLVVLDQENRVVTGRTYPKMVTIQTEIIAPGNLRITAMDAVIPVEPIDINLLEYDAEKPDKKKHTIVPTAIWGSKLKVQLCGEIYDQWFSKVLLGKPEGLRLARYHHSKPVRPVCSILAHEPYLTRADTGMLGDATSYMLMNLSSVADLNKRLQKPVQPIQFRSNFHLKMDQDEPYAEDNWSWIKIGGGDADADGDDGAVFRIVAPCTRCIMPNIDPNTGERDANSEPLRTLKTYRKAPKYASPPLGSHMGLRRRGVVHPNDVIYVADDE